ncbi:endonuclease/exonuclease/phosphatase family metal-dependent hydrolase [Streptomyces griseochromogenes]|uniref:Hydrolase n=1 Tax=Streptomyces griseochromogenes TaxID=68214 RepID=A0A1B1B7T8_9ACTN|nr:endonuclease/exonuclease/phosphatase family protein [Streptomyces griseochromogenes]ANP54906.1 hydrolase [Streptomyces griseochromogenes]MBP2048502.1 endonuclease/exonuclease/phosphatase family metal-dependent hydrolase [Streptomyces griseochromogenes]
MSIRIATFNMENLFRRPTAFRVTEPAKRREILDDFDKLVALLDLATYTDDDKKEIVRLIKRYRAYAIDPENPPPIFVNQSRPGRHSGLFETSGPADNPHIEIKAGGRASWTGWAELGQDDLDMSVVRNTGRVVAEVDADILLTVEVEDRLTLERFNTHVLAGALGRRPYPYNLLVDGNDARGIDIGILSRHPITSVRSHIFDTDPDQPADRLFSRDCPEFEIQLDGSPLVILGNHLKSKFQDDPDLRLAQAKRVAEIYRAAAERTPHVMVAGDLNDDPGSEAVAELVDAGLRDVMSHRVYHGEPGTHGTCASSEDKLDYLLLPPPLWHEVQHVGLETRGIHADGIKSFDTVTSKLNEASDHAALYVDLDL